MMAPRTNPFRRLLAYGIDISLLYAGLLAVQFGFHFLTRWAVPDWLVAGGDYVLVYGWIVLTISLPMWLYFILFESGPRGATPGKALLGLRVTDLAGRRIALSRASLRTACKLAFFEIGHLSFLFPTPLADEAVPSFRVGFVIVPALMGLYFVLTFVTRRGQSVHDLVARTLVVRRPAEAAGS